VKGFAGWLVEAEAASLQARPAPEMYDGCSVLYRGYIANVSALIEESKERGEALKDTSDGQLFVKAYHWWGEKLQSRVLGEYAVAVFNKSVRVYSSPMTHSVFLFSIQRGRMVLRLLHTYTTWFCSLASKTLMRSTLQTISRHVV